MGDCLYVLENDVFSSFLFYGTILVLKMMLMTVLTTVQRMRFNAFVSSEDVAHLGDDPQARKKALLPNENVERVCYVVLFILATSCWNRWRKAGYCLRLNFSSLDTCASPSG